MPLCGATVIMVVLIIITLHYNATKILLYRCNSSCNLQLPQTNDELYTATPGFYAFGNISIGVGWWLYC
jgi:hypothetical protein